MQLLKFSIAEALVSLKRGWRAALLSMLAIVGTVFVLGLLLLASRNVAAALDRVTSSAEMSVYLRDDATPAQIEAIRSALAADAAVGEVEHVSKDQARDRFAAEFADSWALMSALGSNPLPASFEIRLKAGDHDARQIDRLVGALGAQAGVADVRFDRELIERLRLVGRLVGGVGGAIALVLVFVGGLTVMCVVRLAYVARHDEVAIMYLVGAPSRAIKGPFAAEGGLQTTIGALVALVALRLVFAIVGGRASDLLESQLGLPALEFLPLTSCALAVLGSACLGTLVGLLAASGGAGRGALLSRRDADEPLLAPPEPLEAPFRRVDR